MPPQSGSEEVVGDEKSVLGGQDVRVATEDCRYVLKHDLWVERAPAVYNTRSMISTCFIYSMT